MYIFWRSLQSLFSGRIILNKNALKYMAIHKFHRDFRSLRYSSQDGHSEGEHVNRGRDTPNFCPTLEVLDMSTLGDAADVYPVITFLHMCGRNLITGLTSAASPRLDISNTCKIGQKSGVSLPPFTCSPSAWPSRLLYRRGRKSRRAYELPCIQAIYPEDFDSEYIETTSMCEQLMLETQRYVRNKGFSKFQL